MASSAAGWRGSIALGAILLLHLALGWILSRSSAFATMHALAVAAVALGTTVSLPRPKVVLCVCSYVVGCEVLWRMCDAAIFWESGKYLLAAVLAAALGRSPSARAPAPVVFYFLLLLPSSLLTVWLLDWASAREQLSFNLSGPFSLALAVAYFSNVRLKLDDLRPATAAIAAPVSAISAVVLLRMAALSEIDFGMDSNFGSSGGFGPNQVAAALGLGGLFCLIALLFCRLHLAERGATMAFAGLAFTQSALTFSRGGVYLALAAAGAAAALLLCARVIRQRVLLTAGGLTLAALVALPYANAWTGGLLIERFTDADLTHRDELVRDDFAVWLTNPLFGAGPGLAAEERGADFGGAAAHTEFTRALAEHGLFGLASTLLLGWIASRRFSHAQAPVEKALLAALFVWPLLYVAVNSMRIAAPSFLFGLAFARWSAFPKQATRPESRFTARSMPLLPVDPHFACKTSCPLPRS